jgi:hypothetical protein
MAISLRFDARHADSFPPVNLGVRRSLQATAAERSLDRARDRAVV